MPAAPYDPYMYVRNTERVVKLMEVDPSYQDSNGFPFGMLLTSNYDGEVSIPGPLVSLMNQASKKADDLVEREIFVKYLREAKDALE